MLSIGLVCVERIRNPDNGMQILLLAIQQYRNDLRERPCEADLAFEIDREVAPIHRLRCLKRAKPWNRFEIADEIGASQSNSEGVEGRRRIAQCGLEGH
jgi:hypothetical protein